MKADIKMIDTSGRLRGTDEAQVKRLMASIQEVGLLNPITVIEADIIPNGLMVFKKGWRLVAGMHRLEVAKRLGWTEIEAHVIEASDLQAKMAECDENLVGSTLTPAERAYLTQQRKNFYEALHPETRHGAVGRGGKKSRQVGDSYTETNDCFTVDTAAKTGQSERAVQRDAARGEKVADDVLEAIKGTPLDKGTVLDQLAATPREQQAEKVEEIKRQKQEPKLPKPKPQKEDVESDGARASRDFAEWLLKPTDVAIPTIKTWVREHIPGKTLEFLNEMTAA